MGATQFDNRKPSAHLLAAVSPQWNQKRRHDPETADELQRPIQRSRTTLSGTDNVVSGEEQMFKQSIKDWRAERLYDKSMWRLENDNMKE